MNDLLLRHVAMLTAVLLLASCSKPGETPVENQAAEAQAAEAAAVAPAVNPEQATALKGFIEKGGNDCEEVTSVQSEELSSKITVTCRDSARNEAKYLIDMESEQAQKVG